jgi:hypothetical protein
MELVAGESLRRRLERGGALPWREAVRVAKETLLGLGYAHGRGVAHRDLKPENLLVAEDGRVRVVDFGLSRIVRGESAQDTARLTRTNVILGTYEYMAPEQRLGSAEVDERADLYALGVILYECLTGSLPLGRFPAPSEARPGSPRSLDDVVHRALAPLPKDRFPSAAAFREALEEAEARAAKEESAAPLAPVLRADEARLSSARSVLRHVELLAAFDRVLGVVFMLLGAGLWARTVRPFLSPFAVWVGVPGVVFLVAGFLLFRLGRRLGEMEPGSREAQVTASIFLLVLFPPVGVYGLVVMTAQRARDAFEIGRARLLAPPPFAPPPPPPSRAVALAARPRRRAFLPRAAVTFGLAIAAVTLIPSLRDNSHAEVAVFVLGIALVVAAVWTRFGAVGWVRALVYAALFLALGLIVWGAVAEDDDAGRLHRRGPSRLAVPVRPG